MSDYLTKLEREVLSYPKVAELLEDDPSLEKQVLANIEEIKGNFNPKLIKASIKVLDATLAKLYDSFSLTLPKGFSFEQALKSHHVVLVPNHQSHADYIALTYMFYKRFEVPIFIAAGINLNIFPIGKFFSNSGAFFMRRSFGDDKVYKYSFEAYIYYLLGQAGAIEFFFEGGRSRTGKLKSPRFGLFQMILEAYQLRRASGKSSKPLMFVPVTIAHEIVPEDKAHAKELKGKKKVKEKATQLFKIFSLASKRLGSIHVRLQPGIVVDDFDDLKEKTQELAFQCFRSVGRGMPVTPSSLLAMVMLDDSSGALNWTTIKERAFELLDYCNHFSIPLSNSLEKGNGPQSLKRALKTFISNNKVEEIYRKTIKERYYSVKPEFRVEMLYFKNMILHHFIVPYFISSAWYQVFNGTIQNVKDLNIFLINKRRELKFEFYLPSFKETLDEAIRIISYAVGRDVKDLEEAFSLSPQELYKIALKVRSFSTAFSYIFECYYLATLGLKSLEAEKSFTGDHFLKVTKERHEMELIHGKVVRYQESYLAPVLLTSLDFFAHHKAIEKLDKDLFKVIDAKKIASLGHKFAKDLGDNVSVNIKLHEDDSISETV